MGNIPNEIGNWNDRYTKKADKTFLTASGIWTCLKLISYEARPVGLKEHGIRAVDF